MKDVKINRDTSDVIYIGTNEDVERLVKANSLNLSFGQMDNNEAFRKYLENRKELFDWAISAGSGASYPDVERAIYPALILADPYLPTEKDSKEICGGGGIIRFVNEILHAPQSYVLFGKNDDNEEAIGTREYCEEHNVPIIGESGLVALLPGLE